MHLIDDIFPTLLEIMPSLISPRSFVLLVADERKLLLRQKRSIYHLFFQQMQKAFMALELLDPLAADAMQKTAPTDRQICTMGNVKKLITRSLWEISNCFLPVIAQKYQKN